MKVCKCSHGKFLHKNSAGKCRGVKTVVYNPLKHGDIFARTSPCKCKKFKPIKPKKNN
jgi:hypothetical protein